MEAELRSHSFLTLVHDGGKWSAPRTGLSRRPLNGALGGLQSQSGHLGGKINLLPLLGMQ
jgi:hypothetical protein